ncbi:MAG: Na+/H+ antiporter NhaA, partial [Caldimonas sp.]
LAAMIPIRSRPDDETGVESPLLRLEHALQPGVAYLIVPLFGFANAGVSFAGLTAASLMQAVPLGIAAGLLVGKQVGICLFSWAAIRFDVARLPASASWLQFYGVALLCGIGFTMSLFIGLLAFPSSPELIDGVKTGVIAGSLLSALAGVAVLLLADSRSKADS